MICKRSTGVSLFVMGILFLIAFVNTTHAAEIDTILNIRYDTIAGVNPDFLSLNLTTPGLTGVRPVMVYVHGGGWVAGDKDGVDAKPSYFNGRNWAFVSVNYRLVPDVTWEKQPRDVARALSWVHQHISEYGGDPKRMYLMGHSAGCHLAALVTTDPSYLAAQGLSLSVLKGTIALDTKTYDLVMKANDGGGTLTSEYSNVFTTDPAVWAIASPALRIQPQSGIPPVVVAFSTGSGDSVDRQKQAQNFSNVLNAAGVSSIVVNGSPRTHIEINRQFGLPDDSVTIACMAFLDAHSQVTGSTPFVRMANSRSTTSHLSIASVKLLESNWKPNPGIIFDIRGRNLRERSTAPGIYLRLPEEISPQ